jgi:biopolymer transport protein ExbB
MTYDLLHQAIMWAMGGMTMLMLFVAIERGIFFSNALSEGRTMEDYIRSHLVDGNLREEVLNKFVDAKSPQVVAIREVIKSGQLAKDDMEYLVQAQYADAQPTIHARLWIMETIATMAPLMGLLGTIFGIVDAFLALSQGGASSDPTMVSRGIGAALFATAFGIAIALFAFMFSNFFNAKATQVSAQIKRASLRYLAHR